MDQNLIFWPAIIQAAITLSLYIILFRRRLASMKSGETRVKDYAVPKDETLPIEQASRSLTSQFELPVLFLTLIPILYVTDNVNFLQIFLAYFFNLCRFIHLVVHVRSNRISMRFRAFLAGFFTLCVMWAVFALSMLDIL